MPFVQMRMGSQGERSRLDGGGQSSARRHQEAQRRGKRPSGVAAKVALDRRVRRHKLEMKMKKWTNDACAELLKQHRDGERLCDTARRLSLSTTRIRALLQQAERLERRTASPLDGLSVRTRNALFFHEIRTVEDLRAALADGSIDDVPNVGKLSKIEIRRWLHSQTPNA